MALTIATNQAVHTFLERTEELVSLCLRFYKQKEVDTVICCLRYFLFVPLLENRRRAGHFRLKALQGSHWVVKVKSLREIKDTRALS